MPSDPSHALHERLPVLVWCPRPRSRRAACPGERADRGPVAPLDRALVTRVRTVRRPGGPDDADAPSVLGQNVRVALASAAWFLAAVLVPAIAGPWELFGLPGLFVSPAGDLVRVCALSGFGTALRLVVEEVTAALGDTGPWERSERSATTD